MNPSTGFLLVVDDEPANRDLLSDGLKHAGYAVATASDGQEAIELLNQQNFDMVLLDMMMPEVGGLEVLQAIREHYSAIRLPVIIVTGDEQSENMVKALSLGANDYVTKPVDFPVLQARIKAQLARRAESQQKTAELEQARQELSQQLQEAAGTEQRRLPWSALWITSAKGGAGKTTLAVNLAIALAEDGHAPVALLDLGSGEAGVIMKLEPKRNLIELVPHLTQIGDDILHDTETMKDCAVEHAAGVTLFAAYRQSDFTKREGIPAAAVRAIIAHLKSKFNCVVVDSPLPIGDDLQLLSAADVVLILAGNSTVLELRETKALLEAFNKRLGATRSELIVNRDTGGRLVNETEMEKRLLKPVYASLPEDKQVVTSSINLGTPIVLSAPNSEIAKSIHALARKLAGDPMATEVKEKKAEAEETEAKQKKKGWSLFGR